MKKIVYVMFFCIFLMNVMGCEAKTIVKEPAEVSDTIPVIEKAKDTIPFNERRFIYNNGIKVEQNSTKAVDENKVTITSNFPTIAGLKNKLVQDKINKDIQDAGRELFSQFEASFLKLRQADIERINGKDTTAYISYSFNNVIVVDFVVYIDVIYKNNRYYQNYKTSSTGYDLNTGEKLKLDDLFKPDSNYKAEINGFISQYIIDNNLDDYEAERMTKPFQGIRDNQSFSIGFGGVRIILDEKNDEFYNNQFTDQVNIPFKYFGDDLYIFDKYFDENDNIYENSKLTKKLFPNELEFKMSNIIQEDSPGYYIYITEGEFIHVPNKEIEDRLKEMIASHFDIDDFRVKAKDYAERGKNSQYSHHVNLFMNAGGYLSMAVIEDIRFDTLHDYHREILNYDFNKNREMLLSDIFVDGYDMSDVIKAYIKRNMNYNLTDEIIEIGVKQAIKSNKFTFDEYSIHFNFDPKGANLDDYQKWIFIPWEEFGLDKIKLFN